VNVVDKPRRPIPRWRFSQHSFGLVEFSGDPRIARATTVDTAYLEQKLSAWELNPSDATAIDLLNCATNTQSIEQAKLAAGFLDNQDTEHSKHVTRLIAQTLHSLPHANETGFIQLSHGDISMGTFGMAKQSVASARAKLIRDPRNSIAWVDLSRAYTILGLEDKATRSIEIALSLSPTHRYVLRAATRYFLHIGLLDRARTILIKNKRTPHDPWLTAAELSVSQIVEKPPCFVRAARSLIESSGLPPAQLSELRSAFGTLEFFYGAQRKARQQVRHSLTSPTENAVAQARWIGTKISGIDISPETYQLPRNHEARCWHALAENRWGDASRECIQWLLDEPYSSRPAVLGSFIGISILYDAAFAEAFARAGLVSEPDNGILKNNMVVSLAYADKLDEALELYLSVPSPLPDDLAPYIYLATGGLLMFRTGDISNGRKFYESAQDKAPKNRKLDVMLFRAREEIRLDTTDSIAWLNDVLNQKAPRDSLYIDKFQGMLKKEIANRTPAFVLPATQAIDKIQLDMVESACKALTNSN